MSLSFLQKLSKKNSESGAAMVIALMVMVMLLGFVALALTRTATETTITVNDVAESRSFNAAEAALEDSTRDFATVVENKLNPTEADITKIEAKLVPHFSNDYTFVKKITQIRKAFKVIQTKGSLQGLTSDRDEWQIDVTATEKASGVVSQVRRRFFNDRIPIYQFGAFYQDDLEVNDPPLFIFNGRIHTNGNFFVNSKDNDIRFKSKITVRGEIIRDRWKNGAPLVGAETSDRVYAPNAENQDVLLPTNRGSVTCNTTDTGGILTDITGRNFPYPKCFTNTNWASYSQNFEGNVLTNAKQLNLPVYRINVPLIEMIRRGKNIGDTANINGSLTNVAADENGTLSRERFANKEGIRISLADAQNKLPQCATKTPCGVRLDGDLGGGALGYQPLPMRGTPAYTATAVNGNRLAVSGREVWIKVEIVDFDYDLQKPITKDITQDILSLGVTEPIIKSGSASDLKVNNYSSTNDSRSIIKLQRFTIEGDAIGNSGNSYITSKTINSKSYNFAQRMQNIPANIFTGLGLIPCLNNFPNNVASCNSSYKKDEFPTPLGSSTVSDAEYAHYKLATFDNWLTRVAIVPFPIQLQDTREGNRSNATNNLGSNQVFTNGVMSLVDIDVDNLRRFLDGDFNDNLPITTPYAVSKSGVSLKHTDVPVNRGWVVYFSDRRGDADFDGRYKMEDVNDGSDSLVEEDLDNNGSVDVDTTNEAPGIDSKVSAGYAAVTDHKYYRRGVRLINGQRLPGLYNKDAPTTTKGFTFASENGIYVWKNYNVSGISVISSGTPSTNYSPQGGSAGGEYHIPASIVGDAVTILSNSWDDGQSFAYPNTLAQRAASDTQVRFAMLAGDPLTGRSPSEGLDGAQNGGLINFKRFLEVWTSDRLNYSGSLINLFNAYNSNGRHKPNGATYSPPTRDWTYEASFSDSNRLPPGTPFVYFITFTGFERVNE